MRLGGHTAIRHFRRRSPNESSLLSSIACKKRFRAKGLGVWGLGWWLIFFYLGDSQTEKRACS